MEEYSANNVILVANIDCIGNGKMLCDDAGVSRISYNQSKFPPPFPPQKKTNCFFVNKDLIT